MSIQVISNTATLAAEKAAGESKVENESAPEAKAAGQNEATESDTEEKEEKGQDEEAEDNDSDEESESKDSEDDKPKKKSGSQRRKERAERAEAEAERLRRIVEQMALKTAGDPEPKNVEPKTHQAKTDGEPNPEDFDTHAEFVRAVTRWEIKQENKAAEEKSQKSKLEAEQASAEKSHFERVKSFSEKHEDFQELMESVDDVPVSPTVRDVFMSSEDGPALMYELAKDRANLERICKLPPLAAARELGKIEAKISDASSNEKKPEPKKITNAPKPLAPVGKGSSGTVTKSIYDPDISFAEHERIRREQMRKEA